MTRSIDRYLVLADRRTPFPMHDQRPTFIRVKLSDRHTIMLPITIVEVVPDWVPTQTIARPDRDTGQKHPRGVLSRSYPLSLSHPFTSIEIVLYRLVVCQVDIAQYIERPDMLPCFAKQRAVPPRTA